MIEFLTAMAAFVMPVAVGVGAMILGVYLFEQWVDYD